VKLQQFRQLDQLVVKEYLGARGNWSANEPHLRLSWSNWGFGTEDLADSVKRLAHCGVMYVELHGNRYGPDLGYRGPEVRKVLEDHGLAVSGVCGMVTPEQEFASLLPHVRQRMIDYTRRCIELCVETGGSYVLFGAGAVGRPIRYDDNEMARAAETMRIVADDFVMSGIHGCIEPIRPDETSLVHTFAEADYLISLINHPGIQHFNGDLYHILSGEEHIGTTLLKYGERMINLHLADTNRRALSSGMLDMDIVIMALYARNYQRRVAYCTAEPLGPGANPFVALFGQPNQTVLDDLVMRTAACFYERDAELREASDDELLRAYQVDK
jgi:sugar phosphate isomerase/epimerase